MRDEAFSKTVFAALDWIRSAPSHSLLLRSIPSENTNNVTRAARYTLMVKILIDFNYE